VVARVLALGVPYVTLFSTDESNRAATTSQSAAWLARGPDLSSRLAAYETDAKVTLAGPLAQHKYQPVKNIMKVVAKSAVDVAVAELRFACALGPQKPPPPK
jgi:hypothetical protein